MPAKKTTNSLAAAKAKVLKLEQAAKRKQQVAAAKKDLAKAQSALKKAQGSKTKKAVPSALKAHQFKKKA